MKAASRANVVSTYTVKQPLVRETYEVFQRWDPALSRKANLDALRSANYLGVRSASWLNDLAKVLNRRFDPAGRDQPLVDIARASCPMATWKPILLWHLTRDEFLVRDFLSGWLYDQFASGTWRLRGADVEPYLRGLATRQGVVVKASWTERTTHDTANYLLRLAVEFDLMTGTLTREFTSYHVPDDALLYLLHAAAEVQPNPHRLLQLPDWRMYRLAPDDLQRELFRLHQYGRLRYDVAGSIAELSLPYASAAAYARAELAR
jgi:hypothetical protein